MGSPVIVATFGEVLLRLDPVGHERLVQAGTFGVRYTGAEANVAVALDGLGIHSRVVSKVPDGPIGDACVNYLRRFGVDTALVARGGSRLGLLYLEHGAAQRPSSVIYDRARSAFSESTTADYDWALILDGVQWLHFSGITPALGSQSVAVLSDALDAAKARGLTVSCDLNYRATLWTEDEARQTMTSLMDRVDVLIGNEEDADRVFGIRAEGADIARARLPREAYASVAARLADQFGVSRVAITLRESLSASFNRWSGLLYDGDAHFGPVYEIQPVIDRVGAGDAFAAGLIYGLVQSRPSSECIDFAVAASCLKHSIPGDFALVTKAEVERLVAGDASGRVRR